MELAVDMVERERCGLVAHSGADGPAADDAFQAHRPHQAGHRAAGDVKTVALQLPPDLANAVDAEVGFEHASDLILYCLIPLRPSRQPGRIDALRRCRFLRQGPKMDRPMKGKIHHEDTQTFHRGVQGEGCA